MSWVDIVIIALVVLFAGLGVLIGVQKSALAVGAFLIAFIIAFFLSGVIAEALMGLNAVRGFVFGDDITGQSGGSLYSWIFNGTATTAPSDFVIKNFSEPILKVVDSFRGYSDTFTKANAYAMYCAFNLFTLIVGVALFIVIRGLLVIVTMIIKSFIPHKKSAGNRVAGLFVGIARGVLWALVITIAFSVVGGLSFASGFYKVETEYEKSVLGKYINIAAYSIKNNMFLPNDDQLARLIDKSGFAVSSGDRPEDIDPLLNKKTELYLDLLNLNYTSDNAYSIVGGELVIEDNADLFDGDKYTATGFDGAIKAIVDYNSRAAAAIKTGCLDGIDGVELAAYLDTRSSIFDVIYGSETSTLYTAIENYNNKIAYVKAIADPGSMNQTDKDAITSELADCYTAVKTHIDALAELYPAFTKIAADASVGAFSVGTYPAAAFTFEDLTATA